MKESAITPKVKELVKEIAELWRMEIYEGCWVYDVGFKGPSLYQHGDIIDGHLHLEDDRGNYTRSLSPDKWFPIPSISDCLEKLRKLGWGISIVVYPMGNTHVQIFNAETKRLHVKDTIHEALLSALLEALK